MKVAGGRCEPKSGASQEHDRSRLVATAPGARVRPPAKPHSQALLFAHEKGSMRAAELRE
jgi:hypothetical protein